MNEEIKEILDYLNKFINDKEEVIKYGCEISVKNAKLLLDYITNLQQKVEQLEKENKELNRMCELYSKSLYNADLTKAEKKIEQLENIRKEAIEECKSVIGNPEHTIVSKNELMKLMLNILNKGDNKE